MKHWLKGTSMFGLPALLLVGWLLVAQNLEPNQGHQQVAGDDKVTVTQASPAPPKSISKLGRTRVRLDNLYLGMTRGDALVSRRADSSDRLSVDYSDVGKVTSIDGGGILTLESGESVRVEDDKQLLLDTCGPPDKSSPGLGGCGSDPLEYLYYRVEGGVLLVNVFKPGYPSPEHSEIPKEFWNKICGFTLFVPRQS